ncbi:hypothetical protein LCGC14_0904380, partial [marine sediment metagenome]
LAHSGLSSGNMAKRLHLMIYGPFGTRKTPIAHGLPNTRTLDFDDGMQSVEWAILAGKLDRTLGDVVYETITPPPSMDESKNKIFDYSQDVIDRWLADEDVDPSEWEEYCADQSEGRVYPQFWDTLIIDSGTSLTTGVIVKALQETHRLELSKSWSKRRKGGLTPVMIQDRGAVNILFSNFMTMCFGTGKNVVLICHEYQNVGKKGALHGIEPLLSGQLRQTVPKDFDEVWYSKIKGTVRENKGVLQTAADPMHRCRSRLGCLDPFEEGDFADIKGKVAKFYGVPEDKLWVASHGTTEAKEFAEEVAADAVAI